MQSVEEAKKSCGGEGTLPIFSIIILILLTACDARPVDDAGLMKSYSWKWRVRPSDRRTGSRRPAARHAVHPIAKHCTKKHKEESYRSYCSIRLISCCIIIVPGRCCAITCCRLCRDCLCYSASVPRIICLPSVWFTCLEAPAKIDESCIHCFNGKKQTNIRYNNHWYNNNNVCSVDTGIDIGGYKLMQGSERSKANKSKGDTTMIIAIKMV